MGDMGVNVVDEAHARAALSIGGRPQQVCITSCRVVRRLEPSLLQMPHFLALAWLCKDDYKRGGFRMLPGVDPAGRRTAAVALRHIAFLLPLGAVAAALQVTSSCCSSNLTDSNILTMKL